MTALVATVRVSHTPIQDNHLFGYQPTDSPVVLFQQFIQGTPLPFDLCIKEPSFGGLLAAAMFVPRELLLSPQLLTVLQTHELYASCSWPALAHTTPALAQLLLGLPALFPSDLSVEEQGQRLLTVVTWLCGYILGDLNTGAWPQIETVSHNHYRFDGVADLKFLVLSVFAQGALKGCLDVAGRRFFFRKARASWPGWPKFITILQKRGYAPEVFDDFLLETNQAAPLSLLQT